MMKNKRIIGLSVAVLLGLGMASSHDLCSGGLYYNVTGPGEVTVVAPPSPLTPYTGTVLIPETVYFDGLNHAVTAIADSAFMGSAVTLVQVPSSVTRIGTAAFAHTRELTGVSLPVGLEEVSERLLQGSAVTDVAIPEGVWTIGREALAQCDRLHTVLLPSSTRVLEPGCFDDCYNLFEIYCAAERPPRQPDGGVFAGANALDVIVPDDEAARSYRKADGWADTDALTLWSSDEFSQWVEVGDAACDNGLHRLDLGQHVAYSIFDASGRRLAYTAADRYYLPVDAIDTHYFVVPTTAMSEADPVTVTVPAAAAPQADLLADRHHPIITVHGGSLYISGDNYGTWTAIYDVYGMLYYWRPSVNGSIDTLPRNKVYIVKVGDYTQKVVIY